MIVQFSRCSLTSCGLPADVHFDGQHSYSVDAGNHRRPTIPEITTWSLRHPAVWAIVLIASDLLSCRNFLDKWSICRSFVSRCVVYLRWRNRSTLSERLDGSDRWCFEEVHRWQEFPGISRIRNPTTINWKEIAISIENSSPCFFQIDLVMLRSDLHGWTISSMRTEFCIPLLFHL